MFVARVDYKDIHCPGVYLDAETAVLNRETRGTSPLYSVLVAYVIMMSDLLFAGTLKQRGLSKYRLPDKRAKISCIYHTHTVNLNLCTIFHIFLLFLIKQFSIFFSFASSTAF